MQTTTLLLPVAGFSWIVAAAASEPTISFDRQPDRVRVFAGAQPFTELLFGPERSKPVLHPVFGPGQLRMTRDFPLRRDTPGEARDHPHHESLWYTHGDVNGIDFWALGERSGTIRQTSLRLDGDSIRTTDDWLGPDGGRVCSDERAIRFSVLPGGARMIEFTITLVASDGAVTFGDTKEGSMGIRTHPALRIDRGAEAANSEGVTGGAIWGKAAEWVDYRGTIDGRPAGVAILDHPGNPRHPTTWHARDYGLVAANPFGRRAFGGAAAARGDLVIPAGGKLGFRYAFVFHRGRDEPQPVAAMFKAWTGC